MMSKNNNQHLASQCLDHGWLTETNISKRCHFCDALLNECYHTSDCEIWICPACFEKYKAEYSWAIKDWRLTYQEDYLMNAELKFIKPFKKHSEKWDHEHCEFCTAKFMEGDYEDVLHEGYSTLDKKHWICEQCFQDFKGMFNFTVAD